LEEHDDYLVVVGALHLVGEDSLQSLLEADGYRTEGLR
ncbi:MAG: TraB/GumN family protein, partial [Steroidobacteraceae bacterium]